MPETLSPGRPAPTALRLVPLEDHRKKPPVDYHMHTTYTDGRASVGEMCEAAIAAGMKEILYSEHVRHTSTYFPGFAAEIRSLEHDRLVAYVGAEAKVLDEAGTLDVSPETAALCDALIGSVHGPPCGDGFKGWGAYDRAEAIDLEFRLAKAIVSSSRAHILGHPMGMSIRRFGGVPKHCLVELARACRRHGKAFELNGRYCTDVTEWLELVREAGCRISFGSDAHDTETVGRSWYLFNEGVQVDR